METLLATIYIFCTGHINPNFDQKACVVNMVNCSLKENVELEYCMEFWEE